MRKVLRRVIWVIVGCAVLTFVARWAGALASPSSVIEQYKGYTVPELYEDARHKIMEGKLDSALMVYNVLIEHPQKSKHLYDLARTYNNGGYILFYNFSNYEKAYQYWLKAQEMNEKYGFPGQHTLLNLGNMYQITENREKSQHYYELAFSEALAQGDDSTLLIIYNNMVTSELIDNPFDAKRIPNIDYDFRKLPQSTPLYAYCEHLQKGALLLAERKVDLALLELREAVSHINVALTPDRYETTIAALCASALEGAGRTAEAVGAYQYADSVAVAHGQLDYSKGLNEKLSKIYHALGQEKASIQCMMRSCQLADSVFNLSLINRMHDMGTMAELDKINEQMVLIEHKRQIQSIALYGAIGLIVIIAGFLGWIWMLYRREQHKNELLYSHTMQSVSQTAVPAKAPQQINDSKREELAEKVAEMLSSPAPLQPDFTIDTLADAVDSNQKYVSQVINEAYGKTFSTLLAELRIREACRITRQIHYRIHRSVGGLQVAQ